MGKFTDARQIVCENCSGKDTTGLHNSVIVGALIKFGLLDCNNDNGFGGKNDQMITWYTFNNSISPSTIYQYDIKQNISTVYKESEAKFDRESFVLKQDFYPSKDGTMIPIFITHKKGLKMDGKRPTLLYAYGGFNISIKPYFSKANSILYENDGVYAIANLRGGSEYEIGRAHV